MSVNVRSTEQRVLDARRLLQDEIDLWVASANESGEVHLIPLSFAWDGAALIMAAPERSLTVRNLRRAGRARVAVGPTRDVVIVEGRVAFHRPEKEPELAETHATGSGFDSRTNDEPYMLIHLLPDRMQTWRTPQELPGRHIMRDGVWLA